MIELLKFVDKSGTPSYYPKLQEEGFAAQYAFPFANKILRNCQFGYDVGCNRIEWALPGAVPVDPFIDTQYHAMNLPDQEPHFIFSSHMLEHYNGSWVEVLNYWNSRLPKYGIVFLYLPHYQQKYWRSWNNRKHVHNLSPQLLQDYFQESGLWGTVMITENADLNGSFYAIAEKK